MKRITINQIMKLDPCYNEQELTELFKKYGSGRSATILEIAESGHKIEDIFWLLFRPQYIPERELHLFSCWCATRALNRERKAGREPDKRSWDAIRAKKKWLAGKITDEGLKAFRNFAANATHAANAAAKEKKSQLKKIIKIIKSM